MLTFVLLAIALLCASGLVCALVARSDRVALVVGTTGCVVACVLGGGASLVSLLGGEAASLRRAWSMPLGEFHVALDSLSSFFLVCVFLVAGLAGLYGNGYLRPYIGKRRVAPALAFFNLLVAAMATLTIARDGMFFLVAWEVMSLSSFFLVSYENDREDVRRAGITYLIASHLGVAFLFMLFAILGRASGSYDFDVFASTRPPGVANLCFLLALAGFGTKAGFWPLHLWLPDAHPAAPSHVSALMSGVMIKMGIYGLLRVLGFLGGPEAWWGGALLAVGGASGVTGVLHANTEHDLKRRLAYSSVENAGVIALGIGLGLLGQSLGNPSIAYLGYAGALVHVLNHGLFKSLLFMGAGSVLHATGTRDINALGGLRRRMPVTAATFLAGSIAISAMPPLNGFVGEWLMFVAAFRGGADLPTLWAICALAVAPALALIGGFTVACFVQAFSGIFLGEPRTPVVSAAHEAGRVMQIPMLAGALGCAALGLWPTGAVSLVSRAAIQLGNLSRTPFDVGGPLLAITRAAAVLLALVAMLAIARRALLRRREVAQAATWACGYAAPTPRMQYTADSFAGPLVDPFAPLLQARTRQSGPTGFFPAEAHYRKYFGDMAGERLLVPASRRVIRTLGRLHVLQQGRLHLYLAYIAVTLIVLLVWQLVGANR